MNFFAAAFYDFAILSYRIGIHISSLWNTKAEHWIKGRRNLFSIILSQLSSSEKRVWFHCASSGEFEQARPVVESFRKKYRDHKIVITFFSPSGFEQHKNYTGADYIFYLPLDTRSNAKRFISIIEPRLVVFVKYEYWMNLLNELRKRKIPALLISAVFRLDHFFFRWYGHPFTKSLNVFNHICVQDADSLQRLNDLGYSHGLVAGDTRFDRVLQISSSPDSIPLIEKFKGQRKLFVAGSTWPQDERLLANLISLSNPNWKWVIVPHEINTPSYFLKHEAAVFTESDLNSIAEKNILIINKVGLLSSAYQYADIAYIGGGFGKGIHNLLEAAVYGIPVIFGPNYSKFNEAKELLKEGVAATVVNPSELNDAFNSFQSEAKRSAAQINHEYVKKKSGATEQVINLIGMLIK